MLEYNEGTRRASERATVLRFCRPGISSQSEAASARSASSETRCAKSSPFTRSASSRTSLGSRRFLYYKQIAASPCCVAPPFRKRSRSAHLFACKRAHNGSLSLPTFCGRSVMMIRSAPGADDPTPLMTVPYYGADAHGGKPRRSGLQRAQKHPVYRACRGTSDKRGVIVRVGFGSCRGVSPRHPQNRRRHRRRRRPDAGQRRPRPQWP